MKTQLVWTPAKVGCYWYAADFTIGTSGPAFGPHVFPASAISLHAETVYLTAHGKTYHTNPKCMALSRAAHVLETDDSTAIAHGLHECGICAHRKSKGTAKPDNSQFAKETK